MKLAMRILTGVLAVGLGIGHWFLIGFPDQEVSQAQARTLSASVEPLPLSLSCPGAFVQLGGPDGTDLGKVERLGSALVAVQSSEPELLESPELSISGFDSATVAGSPQSTELLSMLQAQAVDQQRAIGIQASFCPQPLAAGWLINGAAVSGAESILVAANPADVEALIQIDVHVSNTVVSDTFALAPGEEKLISMARYANGERLFALSFQTNGPEILMAMQNRETRGLTPIGIETEVPLATAATSAQFVGLRELTGGFTLPEIRVYNPNEDATEVIINALDGENVELFRMQVPAGAFESLELALSESYQLVTLESELPVLSAIKSFAIDPTLDFAWILPAETFRSLSIPLTSYQNSLVLANPGTSPNEITVSITSGTRTSVQSLVLPALSTTAIRVAGSSVKVVGSGDYLAALEILDPAGYSVVTPTENANLGNDLQIRID